VVLRIENVDWEYQWFHLLSKCVSMSANSFVRSLPLFDSVRNKLVHLVATGIINYSNIDRSKIAAQLYKLTYEQSIQLSLIMIHYTYLSSPHINVFTPEACDPKKKGRTGLPYGIVISPGGKGFSLDVSLCPDELVYMIYAYLQPN
jgi:hypothetical protein